MSQSLWPIKSPHCKCVHPKLRQPCTLLKGIFFTKSPTTPSQQFLPGIFHTSPGEFAIGFGAICTPFFSGKKRPPRAAPLLTQENPDFQAATQHVFCFCRSDGSFREPRLKIKREALPVINDYCIHKLYANGYVRRDRIQHANQLNHLQIVRIPCGHGQLYWLASFFPNFPSHKIQ